MGRASSKKIENAVVSAESCILDIVSPILETLAAIRPATAGDNGHDAVTDGSLKFMVGSWLQNLYDQTYGKIQFRDKRTGAMVSIPNAKQRYDQSEASWHNLRTKHAGNDEGLIADVDYDRVTGWFKVNEARFNANRRLIDVFTAVYQVCSGTDFEWKPRAETAIKEQVLSASEKAAKLAALNTMPSAQAA